MITIIDSGGNNIASIQYALNRLGVSAQLSDDANTIMRSSHLILPGVGSADRAMKQLNENGLIDVVRSLKQPVLGICLGMQILFENSDEKNIACLGIIPGNVELLSKPEINLIVPHMGWNQLEMVDQSSLLKNVPNEAYMYFVHSYVAPINKYTAARAIHGEPFSAAVQFNNFFGVQFHPERSGPMGALILKNFLEC